MKNGQQNKHLSWFKVENFKCFEAFEMEDIGQFNLIFGDNNTGKTTVLEALMFDERNFNQFLFNLYTSLSIRGLFDEKKIPNLVLDTRIFKSFTNINSEQSKSKFYYSTNLFKQTKNEIHIEFTRVEHISQSMITHLKRNTLTNDLPKSIVIFHYKDKDYPFSAMYQENMNSPYSYIPYISFGDTYRDDLVPFYSNIQDSTKQKKRFIQSLSLFIDKIEDIEISASYSNEPHIAIRFNNSDRPVPLAMLGDGAKRLFRILVELPICKHRRLMIDEIDTGIHYSRFKDFWKTILVAAKENDVQIFATTHNKDGLRYFYEALEELPEYQQDARCFTLSRIKDDSVKSYTQTYEQFEHALHYDIEIRGRQ